MSAARTPPRPAGIDLDVGLDACNCLSLRRAARRVTLFYDLCLAGAGLRATQFAMLALLAERGGVPVATLAAALDLERSTAGQNVKLLEREGLVTMRRATADRRVKAVALTPAGHARLAAAAPLWRRAQAAMAELNGADALRRMRRAAAAVRVPGGHDVPAT